MQAIELGRTGIFGVVILLGAYQGLILSLAFWFRPRGDRVANRLLAALLLIITAHLSEIFLDVAGLLARFPAASAATFPLVFLLGPAFYLYLRRVSGERMRFRPGWLLHLVPAVVVAVSLVPWYLAPAQAKAGWHASRAWGGHSDLDLRTYVFLFVNLAQNISYAWLGQRLLRRRRDELSGVSADNELLAGLATHRAIARAFAFYAAGYAVLFVALLIWGGYSAEIDTVWLVLIALFLHFLGFSAVQLPDTSQRIPRESAPADNGPKYAKAELPPARTREIFRGVRELMEQDRLYLDRELKLAVVSRRLGVSQHHLSQAINREGGARFVEIVNRYRVEEAQRLMEDPGNDSLTVLAIAFDAGFNNKASFNQAFKRFTGMTPSEWRRSRAVAK